MIEIDCTAERDHIIEIDHTTEIDHIVGIDHGTITEEMTIEKKIIGNYVQVLF